MNREKVLFEALKKILKARQVSHAKRIAQEALALIKYEAQN